VTAVGQSAAERRVHPPDGRLVLFSSCRVDPMGCRPRTLPAESRSPPGYRSRRFAADGGKEKKSIGGKTGMAPPPGPPAMDPGGLPGAGREWNVAESMQPRWSGRQTGSCPGAGADDRRGR
jgi:hypothetical protein